MRATICLYIISAFQQNTDLYMKALAMIPRKGVRFSTLAKRCGHVPEEYIYNSALVPVSVYREGSSSQMANARPLAVRCFHLPTALDTIYLLVFRVNTKIL